MNIIELQKLWECESESYKKKEIGSGVQFFVKKVLQCEQLFNLKEGKLSTPDESRQNEFLEEPSKKNKRADIVIFVTNEIVLPIEVERHENIEIGEKQLFEYQLVWDKKTGILTDGFEWRFYISKIPVKSFSIIEMLNKPEEFLVFWNEFIQPINYYISFFKQEIVTKNVFESLDVAENRQKFFTDITTLIYSFTKKLNLKAYFDDYFKAQKINESEGHKFAIEITYSYLIQFILYKTLADNDFAQFKDDFYQRQNRLLANLQINNYGDILTVTKAISTKISENIYRPFSEEQLIINKKLEKILEKPRNELHEVTPWLDIFVFIQRYNFANIQSEIFGFIYENYLKQLYHEKLGQYFTAPEVTDFMLEQIGYSGKELENQIKKDQISIIDPSCGSGTFLYGAVRNVIKIIDKNPQGFKKLAGLVTDNIFGIDVAEFPLYLAEMSIIMRMLPHIVNEKYNNPIDKKLKIFKTKDTVSEFLDTQIRNTLTDVNVAMDRNKGQMNLFANSLNLEYESFIRDKSDLEELKQSLENQNEPRIDRYRFDYVIGNPPYISYNESSSQGILIFKFIKEKLVKLNDIYGVNLHSVPENQKKYRPNPNLYAFFFAVGLALLKDGGKLCYIVPQTLLTAGDLDVLRYHLSKFITIEKIITFNSKLFINRGLKQTQDVTTSSLIIVVKKIPPAKLHECEVLHYTKKNVEISECLSDISKRKNMIISTIRQNELEKKFRNWNYIIKDKIYIEIKDLYLNNSESIEIYYNHHLSKQKFNSRFIFDSGYDIDDEKIYVEKPDGENFYYYPRLVKDFYTIKEFRGYFPNNRNAELPHFIKLRQANQGYELLDSTYKIVWSYSNPSRFFFTDVPLIWPRNQINAIGSENKNELYYLFALLNSKINRYILQNYLESENEKNLQISTSSIKEFIKVPIITEKNQFLKDKIIELVNELLDLEQVTLSDLVDFSNVMFQKVDNISFHENYIYLHNETNSVKCKIIDKPELIEKGVKELVFGNKIALQEVKNHFCIDFNQAELIMNKINELVFALYFIVNKPVTNENEISLSDNEYYIYLLRN